MHPRGRVRRRADRVGVRRAFARRSGWMRRRRPGRPRGGRTRRDDAPTGEVFERFGKPVPFVVAGHLGEYPSAVLAKPAVPSQLPLPPWLQATPGSETGGAAGRGSGKRARSARRRDRRRGGARGGGRRRGRPRRRRRPGWRDGARHERVGETVSVRVGECDEAGVVGSPARVSPAGRGQTPVPTVGNRAKEGAEGAPVTRATARRAAETVGQSSSSAPRAGRDAARNSASASARARRARAMGSGRRARREAPGPPQEVELGTEAGAGSVQGSSTRRRGVRRSVGTRPRFVRNPAARREGQETNRRSTSL